MSPVAVRKAPIAWVGGLLAAIAICSRTVWVRPAGLAAITLVGTPAIVDADEMRTFAVSVDGKPAGTYTLATAWAADGTETIVASAEVKVKTTFFTYTYELQSTEIWKSGQLISINARSNDDGKQHVVTSDTKSGVMTVTVDKDTRKIPASILTATGVRVPAGNEARDAILFDSEDGSDSKVRVEPLGPCRLTFNGKVLEGSKYKLTGKGIAAEWWFDSNGRPIRQENKWDGHKVMFELTSVVQRR